ncbi:hypothetical protein JK358_08680 [Nocardia sp. 2]|uniref:DUF222 domain-containing protein n=1 Tax=Nocardia acididurans TaxID=2802282 RepID=A0ABS1M1T9_9NOCA|nr:hypothetical protein [Nocardia acididurans]MBL1074471.1 hypothetical protein [Nocardia acididurans]
MSISARELRAVVRKLPARQPITDSYEQAHPGPQSKWPSQRDHLLGWLAEYDGVGYYGREHPGQDARFFYTHFKCAPGLLWLAEALGEDPARLREAVTRVEAAGGNLARQCGAFRAAIPWARIEELLAAQPINCPRSLLRRISKRSPRHTH